MAFVCVAKATDIAPGQIREIQLQRITIAVANVGGQFHAISNTCLHRGGPLGQGSLQGNVVTCPWHGWSFDVTSGKVTPTRPSESPVTLLSYAATTCTWTHVVPR